MTLDNDKPVDPNNDQLIEHYRFWGRCYSAMYNQMIDDGVPPWAAGMSLALHMIDNTLGRMKDE